jgi:hypothetical protein
MSVAEIEREAQKNGWKKELIIWAYEGKREVNQIVEKKGRLPQIVQKEAYLLKKYKVTPELCSNCAKRNVSLDYVKLASHLNVVYSCQNRIYGAFANGTFTMIWMNRDLPQWQILEEKVLDSFEEVLTEFKNGKIDLILSDKNEFENRLKIQL